MKKRMLIALALVLLISAVPPISFAEEATTLRVLTTYTDVDRATDPSRAWVEEATGYTVVYDTLPASNPYDQLNLMFVSGDVDYDYVLIGADALAKNIFYTFAANGLLTDLTDMLPQYENIMNFDERLLNTLAIDGRIYAICSSALALTNPNNMVRYDWLEACGLEAPTNRQEFYEMLVAFKETDPDGLGANLIPFSCTATDMVATISATFGILYDYEVRDGAIIDTRLTPEYKEYLTFMHQLFSEGLLDPDFAVNTSLTLDEKVAAGRVGYYAGWVDTASNYLQALWDAGIEDKGMFAIEPLQDDEGRQRLRSGHNGQGLSQIGFIPASSDKAAEVLDFINKFHDPETFVWLIHGEEGVDYEVVDGERRPLDAFSERRNNMHAFFLVQDGEAYFDLWQLRTRKNPAYDAVARTIFETAEGHIEWPVMGFSPAFGEVSTQITMVQEYAVQEATKFIAGARSLDEFDQFVEEMIARGANEILDAYNAWYQNQ
ncbi:MAG: extracellular solute-binding protein [Clostridiales bacterium]|nr:extracellular solute-binding protein [Clostridiales bacterium]